MASQLNDKIRNNLVQFTKDMVDQYTLCSALEAGRVFSAENSDEVLSHPTKTAKNQKLLQLLQTKILRGFPVFCKGLETTGQLELLALLDGQTNVQLEGQAKEECSICMDKKSRIAFIPCGHIVTCEDCSKRVQTCPCCRRVIDSRLVTYT
jgi:hypothetical protein